MNGQKLGFWRGSLALSLLLSASTGCEEELDAADGGALGMLDSSVTPGADDAGGGQSDGQVVVPDGGGGSLGAGDGGVAPGSDGSVAPDAAGPLPPFEGEGQPWLEPAPRATCGAGEQPDQAIAGLNAELRCNLEVLGTAPAPHFLSLAFHDECAYVNGADGTTVIHVDAAGTPTVTATLTEVGMRSNWESMKANPVSGLLAGYESNGPRLTIYDVGTDCKAPVLQSNTSLDLIPLIGSLGHAGSFSPDGTIYYASSMFSGDVFAVDLMNPKAPTVITTTFDRGAHDLFVGKNGTRGYFANPDVTQSLSIGSFAVMDLTQIQARVPDAKGTLIHEIKWEDGATSQYPILVSYRGKDHLIINDELGSGACGDAAKPQWGYTRIFDLSDEKSPRLMSLIKTEAQDPKNCMAAAESIGGNTGGFGLGTHYCNVDRLEDPRLMSCGNFDGGVRVYDIRNPWRPKEVAYFDKLDVYVPSMQRIVAEKRELWVASSPGTFYVLKFTPGSAADTILSN